MQLIKILCSFLTTGLILASTSVTAQSWTDPEQISDRPSSVNPTPSNLVIDPNSNAITGWLQGSVGVDNTLYTSSLPEGASSWRNPEVLYTGTSPEFATFPILFADNLGIVKALWANFRENEGIFNQTTLLSSSQLVLGTAWSTPIISSTLTGFPNGGGASVDEQGNQLGVLALATDNQTYTPPFTITLVALANEATSWTVPIELGIDNSTISPPAIFSGAAQGIGLVGWRMDSPLSLKTARYDFSSGIVHPLNDLPLPSGTTDIGFVRGVVAADGNATIVVGLQNGEGTNYVLYSSFLPAQSNIWTYPKIFSNPVNNTAFNYLSLKADEEGNSVILWGELTPEGTSYIRAGTLVFGGDIANITDLTNPNPSVPVTVNDFSGVNVDVDQVGNAAAIWQLVIDGAPSVQVASLPAGGVWTSPKTLSTTGGFGRIALSNQGTGIVVWLDSVTSLEYGSKNDHLFPLDSPSGFAGYFSQGPGTDYYLNMHWAPSSANNVLNYEIFKDDELIANIAGSGPFTHTLLLDCRSLDAAYTLVAVGSNGNKSVPVSFTLTE